MHAFSRFMRLCFMLTCAFHFLWALCVWICLLYFNTCTYLGRHMKKFFHLIMTSNRKRSVPTSLALLAGDGWNGYNRILFCKSKASVGPCCWLAGADRCCGAKLTRWGLKDHFAKPSVGSIWIFHSGGRHLGPTMCLNNTSHSLLSLCGSAWCPGPARCFTMTESWGKGLEGQKIRG